MATQRDSGFEELSDGSDEVVQQSCNVSLIAQAVTTSSSPSVNTPSGQPPCYVSINKIEYILRQKLAHQSRRHSAIWQAPHGYEICRRDGADVRWLCGHCKKHTTYRANSTTNMREHLVNRHSLQFDDDGNLVQKPSGKRKSLSVAELQQAAATKRFRPATTQKEGEEMRRRLLHWITTCHIPLSVVENQSFRSLLDCFNPRLTSELPRSGDTVRSHVLQAFKASKITLTKHLHQAKSLINYSFDLWTSPGYHAVLGVTAHFIEASYHKQDIILGLRELGGPHSGEKQAAVIIELLKEYELGSISGYFTLDNASNNDVAITEIFKHLTDAPRLSAKEVRSRRLFCLAHVLNLAAKAFLFGRDSDAYENDEAPTVDIEEANLKRYRDLGAVGKLHNVVQ